MLVKKKSSPKRLISGLLVLVVILSAIYGFLFAPVFKIQAVKIIGSGASGEEVEGYLGGSIIGENILLWHPKEGGDLELAKKLEAISVSKNLWTREIIVRITPREKKLIWCYEVQDQCFWADRKGNIFEEAPKITGSLIHVVFDKTGTESVLGSRVLPDDLWQNLIKISEIIDEVGLGVVSINIEPKLRELIVKPTSGPTITFGLNINSDFMETAIISIKNSGWQNIKSINLTVYGRAYTVY